MKFLSCYVERFGRLEQYYREFEPGLNVFVHENGFGKSTLCAFLSAMLYGLPASRSQDIHENERKHYLPWSGGCAGGTLSFSVGDRSYRIERSFGATPSEDTFKLYSLDTGLPSTDFADPVGEALFGIDAEGYERSTFFSARRLDPKRGYAGISARLAEEEDLALADRAMARLEERRRYYRMPGERGRLPSLAREIAEYRARLDELKQKTAERAAIDAELAKTERGIAKLHDLRDAIIRETAGEARGKAERLSDAAREAAEAKAALGNQMPTGEEIAGLEAKAEAHEARKHRFKRRLALALSPMLAALPLFISGAALPKLPLILAAAGLALGSIAAAFILAGRVRKSEASLNAALSRYPAAAGNGSDMLGRVEQLRLGISRAEAAAEAYRLAREETESSRAEELSRIEASIRRAREHEAGLKSRAIAMAELANEAERLESELPQKEAEHRAAELSLSAILAAEEALAEAKNAMISRYRGAVESGFLHYARLLFPDADEMAFSVNTEFAVSYRAYGQTRPIAALSQGEAALAKLCLRLSLTDALYREEKPPMTLDDPLAPLDDARLEAVLPLLSGLAENRQILYFTCSNARNPL